MQETKITQKLAAFLYTNNDQYNKKIKKTVPLAIASKSIKYLGRNLPKEVKDLDTKNYKTLLKEIREDINKWKHVHGHGLENLILLKCLYYPKSIYLIQSLLKSQWHFLQK